MTRSAPAPEKPQAVKPSFASGLFRGSISEALIFPFPRLEPDEEESLGLVLESFTRFARDKLDGARFDREMAIPMEIIHELGKLGVLGFTLPEEYGGAGFSTGAYCRLMEAVCRYCAATATVVGGHQSIGIKGILMYGTEEQKREFLPRMASGEWIGAYALTEPGSGSDAAAMSTRAVHKAGDDVWVLNGRKQWITNGGFSEVFTVFARTEIPGETRPARTISCFLVRRNLEGVSTTPPMHKMGIRGSNTVDVVLDNVHVPGNCLLGRPGAGFKMAMEILNTGRLSLAAGCIGSSKQMIDLSVAHALERRAFGRPISEFEMIRQKFAAMMSETYAAESMVYLTTGLCDRGDLDFSLESSICKIFASETLWRVVNHATQIAGGNGYMSEYPYERFLRDARINLIFEGTNEILRHHVSLAGAGAARSLERSGRPQDLEKVYPALREEARDAVIWTERFAAGVQKALAAHGSALAEREYVQKRLADTAIDLYGILAVLSRTTRLLDAGAGEGGERETDLTRLFCRQAGKRIQENLARVDRNDDELLDRVSDSLYRERGYRLG
ncbi:MAG: acyl-CoA dehydrogenase family protein [Acidobacteriota bacterium]